MHISKILVSIQRYVIGLKWNVEIYNTAVSTCIIMHVPLSIHHSTLLSKYTCRFRGIDTLFRSHKINEMLLRRLCVSFNRAHQHFFLVSIDILLYNNYQLFVCVYGWGTCSNRLWTQDGALYSPVQTVYCYIIINLFAGPCIRVLDNARSYL